MITTVFDAAFPPSRIPPGCKAVAGYVGRLNFTPHVWTLPEWQRFSSIPQLPYWVPDLAVAPNLEAAAAVHAVLELGWAPHIADERAVIFDFETASGPADRGWWQECAAAVSAAGFCGVMYGSLSTVLENAAVDVVVAAWDNSAQLLPGQTIHGHQYKAGVAFDGTQIDYSVMDEWLLARAGVGPRH
ncbi:MAG TPA: hypothetical protein VNV62_18560 [Trebonia sp.]|jgi:hypothetical protein|nr:hypothetical protein [Trebonia sp.]